MKNYKITDKATKAIIGVVAMTPAQAWRAEKDFIVNIAQEAKIDSVSKREFLAEWTGLNVEMLFDGELE